MQTTVLFEVLGCSFFLLYFTSTQIQLFCEVMIFIAFLKPTYSMYLILKHNNLILFSIEYSAYMKATLMFDAAGAEDDATRKKVLLLIRSQRRVRGFVTCVEEGKSMIRSGCGEFKFDKRSVKVNKNHPFRIPQVGDACEFRLSHSIPPAAVSIRISVPKQHSAAAIRTCYTLLDDACGPMSPLIYQLPSADLRHSVCILSVVTRIQDNITEGSLVNGLEKITELSQAVSNGTFLESVGGLTDTSQVGNLISTLPENHRNVVVEAILFRSAELLSIPMQVDNPEIPISEIEFDLYFRKAAGSQSFAISRPIFEHLGLSVLADGADTCAPGMLMLKAHNIRTHTIAWPSRSTISSLDDLHHQICNAIQHLPPALCYVAMLKQNDALYSFVAIPVILSACTLYVLWGSESALHRGGGLSRVEASKILNLRYPSLLIAYLRDATIRLRDSVDLTHPRVEYLLSLLNETLATLGKDPRSIDDRLK